MKTKRCPECKRPLPRKKITVRIYVDGIKIFADGRERCLTKASWLKRKQELFDKHRVDDINRDLAPCSDCKLAGKFHQLEADHIFKRSTGRDDRLSNLRLLCNESLNNCHQKRHDEFKRKSSLKNN